MTLLGSSSRTAQRSGLMRLMLKLLASIKSLSHNKLLRRVPWPATDGSDQATGRPCNAVIRWTARSFSSSMA
jgi:hypothetical protein